MVSSVVNSERAILVNIEIVRAFVRLRELTSSYRKLITRVDRLEKNSDATFRVIFDAIKKLSTAEVKQKRPIGFGRENE